MVGKGLPRLEQYVVSMATFSQMEWDKVAAIKQHTLSCLQRTVPTCR